MTLYIIYSVDLFFILGSCAIADIHCLDLQFLAWCKVKTGLRDAGPRYNFTSFERGK